MVKTEDSSEVVIVGGGLVGLSLAVALGQAGIETLVIDGLPPSESLAPSFDGRASAISLASQRVFTALGLWDAIAPYAAPIRHIRVSDGRRGGQSGGASGLFLDYRESDLAMEGGEEAMGHIVENRALRYSLYQAVAKAATVKIVAPAKVSGVARSAGEAAVALADGRRLACRLVVGADGKRSALRRDAGIEAASWPYPQIGLVSTLAHELPHEGVAHEHFLPAGPFAILPLPDDEDEAGRRRHRSSLVWTEREALARTALTFDDAAFAAACQSRFGDSLGKLTPIGPRFGYPLSFLLADRFHDHRLALVGEAAHAMHPIAGQGLNLSIRDVAVLAEVLVDAKRLGLDVGAAATLTDYSRWRRVDSLALCVVTDLLNRLFSNDFPPLRLARDLGLAAVDRVPPVKRYFMSHAMGLAGDLPRLIRGEPL